MPFSLTPPKYLLRARDFEPAYLALHRRGELLRRAEESVAQLEACYVCPRDCGVNRLEDKTAACKTGRYAQVASYFAHFGEEDCLRGWQGSGTIFFSMCNLRCVFCFHPDTFISTGQGIKRIADLFEQGQDEIEHHGAYIRFFRSAGDDRSVRKGEMEVTTRQGNLAPVAKAFRHHFEGNLIRLKPYNCPPLLLTPNHEVFVVSKTDPDRVQKVRAEHLTEAHHLLTPKRIPEAIPAIGERHIRWQETEAYFSIPIDKIEQSPYEGPVFNLEVDDPDHSYVASFVAVSNCQNYDISQANKSVEVGPAELAAIMLELQEMGCHNINFVTPEHVVPQILEALPLAVEAGLRLPLVYNTSAYDSMESLRLLDGIVDIYMPDFKFWDSQLSLRYLKAKDYAEAAGRVIKEMVRQVGPLKFDEKGLAKRGVLLRHLVMPGFLEETQRIFDFLAEEIGPELYVNVMDQYYPAGKVGVEKYAEINRRLKPPEYKEALQLAQQAGFRVDERRPMGWWLMK